LRNVIRTYLEASRLDLIDKNESWNTFVRARAMTASLPEPSKTLMGYVNDRDVGHLGPILLAHVTELGDDRELSPASQAAPRAPVYLLHGTDDNVIPAIESFLLADSLRSRGVEVHQLATPRGNLLGIELSELARADPFIRDGTNPDASKPINGVTNGFAHASHLTIPSFFHHDRQHPVIRIASLCDIQQPDLGGQGPAPV